MKVKFKTLLFIAFAAGFFMGLPSTVQAQTPESCYEGYDYLDYELYEDAVDELTACLRSNSHSQASRARAYYNRALAYSYLYDEEEYVKKNVKKAGDFLIKALEDIDKSIELNPTGNAYAYCLSGYLYIEMSWGFYGYEDVEKGIAMGASKDTCGK